MQATSVQTEQELNITYFKRGLSPRLVVIMVHGGGWTLSANMEDCARFLVQDDDTAAVCVSYRLTRLKQQRLYVLTAAGVFGMLAIMYKTRDHKHVLCLTMVIFCVVLLMVFLLLLDAHEHTKHPNHIHDLVHCVQFVQENKHKLVHDDMRLVLLGHSAGAHLASLLVTKPEYLSRVTANIVGVVLISGVYSLQRLKDSVLSRVLLQLVFPADVDDSCFPLPLTHVPDMQFMVLAAGVDFSILRHTHDLVQALEQAGATYTYELMPDVDHFSIRRNWGTTNATGQRVLDFLRRV